MPHPLSRLRVAGSGVATAPVMGITTSKEPILEGREELVTPDLALSWLERGGKNRPIDHARIKRYAADMRAGNWKRSAEPIHMNPEGQVINGQHRLWSIVESAVPIYLMVVRNVPDEAFEVFDTGKTRTADDVLALSGYQNAKALSAAARNLINYQRTGSPTGTGRNPISNSQIRDFIRDNPLVEAWAHEGVQLERAGLGGRGGWTAILYLLSQVDTDMTRDFVEQLLSGANLPPGSPILALRNRITKARESIDRAELMFLAFKAWNTWRRGGTIQLLAWRRTGDAREDIPRPE